jgi:hypothetical protein
LIQRFSGDSRRLRKLRIFGRTTLEIQFIRALSALSVANLPHGIDGLPYQARQ